MSVRFDAATDYLTRTTGLPSPTNFSASFWLYVSVDATCIPFGLIDTTGAVVAGFAWFKVSDGGTFELWTNGGTVHAAFGSRPAVASWAYVTITGAGTGANQVNASWSGINSSTVVTAAVTMTTPATVTNVYVGSDGPINQDFLNGRISNLKIWDAVLTANELVTERYSYQPKRWANLNSWYPILAPAAANVGLDLSGNGRNLTTGGTLAVEANPPGVRRGYEWAYAA